MERSRDEQDGEDDVVEVELAEVDGLDSLEGWDKEVVGNQAIFIRPFEES
jgi:hypothetical protein